MSKRASIFFVLFALAAFAAAAQEAAAAPAAAAAASAAGSSLKYFAAALAVGIACIAGGIAVGQIGSAAMGAMAENPELSGKALPYAGLAEGICLWGFLVGLLILLL
ncbi:MAG TPA: ATP synthase subunit C [Spirochaetales bacterium]|nr:ATP synthase subunit C [Spirochaetales bacterium]